jgi:SHS2 domain-containing protein
VTYRFLPDTADIKVAFEAETVDELLVEATVVMRGLLAGESPVQGREEREVAISGVDATETFLGFLRELLYEFSTDGFLPVTLAVDYASETEIRGRVAGERFDPTRHETQPEVKAVTRHHLQVERRGDSWHAEVVFDV